MSKLLVLAYFLMTLCLPNLNGIYWGELLTFLLVCYALLTGRVRIRNTILQILLISYVVLFFVILMCFYSLTQYGEGELYYAFRFFRFIYWFLAIYIIKDILIARGNLNYIVNTVFPVIFICHAIAIIFTYVDIGGSRTYLMTISHAQVLIPQVFRASGLWGGFDSASIFMTFATIYTLLVLRSNIIIKILLIFLFTFSSFLTGARIGIALLLVFFILQIFVNIFYGKMRYALYSIYALVFISLSLLVIVNFASDYLPEAFSSTVNRMSEIFINRGSTSSTDHLMTMYYFTDNPYQLLSGNSLDSFSGPNSVQSDVEYIKFFWGVGMPLGFLIFLFVIFILFFIPLKYGVNFNLRFLSLSISIIILLGSMKGEYIFAFRYVPFYMWILWMTLYKYNGISSKLSH
ncbi:MULTISPECIES: hypothetical protein [Vibrio]|uniref:hypothetical protein n=1 Tax=Vibrio TaxID=662 RepID=UPI001CDC78B9|nr:MULTISPECIES: hypothetical protein [Vibrio]MDW2296339.1 hypothetical protein [Vibrio sp. 1404]MCA2457441.1 hypothetical protein [Vibrio alginolyticus]MCA2461945.1 hypothetical protein [Vibrio alginolyticus]MCR9597840.1 hypothetical protein [Vibrio alginolyticus]MCR9603572.1 hypothetical protein [Vibrio alginolyticus]